MLRGAFPASMGHAPTVPLSNRRAIDPTVSVLVAVVAGFLAARLAWILLRPTLYAPVFMRANYRGHPLPTAGGLVIAASVFVVEAIRTVLGALGVGDVASLTPVRLLFLFVLAGFTLLGLADDIGAVGTARGFRGHLSALATGHLTTGGLKLLGGGAVALVVGSLAGGLGGRAPGMGGFGRLIVDALVIALGANLANLLDRAPGRVTKISALTFAAVVVGAAVGKELPTLVGAAVAIGASLGILIDDLHERLMLGDTGANALGAVLGLSVVLTTAPSTRLITVLVLLVLNLSSEMVSFSKVIDAIVPLRMLDRAGALEVRRRFVPE